MGRGGPGVAILGAVNPRGPTCRFLVRFYHIKLHIQPPIAISVQSFGFPPPSPPTAYSHINDNFSMSPICTLTNLLSFASKRYLSLPRSPFLPSTTSQFYATNSSPIDTKKLSETTVANFTTSIPASKSVAVKEMEDLLKNKSFCVFADGSIGPDGGMGAAAVRVSEDGRKWALRKSLKTTMMDNGSRLYEAKLVSAIVGLQAIVSLCNPRHGMPHATIILHCQQVIRELSEPGPDAHPSVRSWHELLQRYLKRRPGLMIDIRWIPREENGLARAEARLTAKGLNGWARLKVARYSLKTASKKD